MIADTSDAMTTHRSYRTALSYERLVMELEEYSGTQFDPAVVAAFRSSTAIKRIIEERQRSAEPIQLGSRGRVAQLIVH